MPSGRVPKARDQVSGGPRDAVNRAEYADPTATGGTAVVVMASEGLIIRSKAFVLERVGDELSVTRIVKLKNPDWVGVPAMTPFAARVIPVGNDPVTNDHEKGAVPPDAASVCE
jgi:hypothetical protein